jgi:hypothetical protein
MGEVDPNVVEGNDGPAVSGPESYFFNGGSARAFQAVSRRVDYDSPHRFRPGGNAYLRSFLCSLNGAVANVLPKSSTTISGWMESLDRTQRDVIKRRVQDTPFSIHFSFDGLTAPNNSPLLGIVVHWMTHIGQKKIL